MTKNIQIYMRMEPSILAPRNSPGQDILVPVNDLQDAIRKALLLSTTACFKLCEYADDEIQNVSEKIHVGFDRILPPVGAGKFIYAEKDFYIESSDDITTEDIMVAMFNDYADYVIADDVKHQNLDLEKAVSKTVKINDGEMVFDAKGQRLWPQLNDHSLAAKIDVHLH